MYTVIWLHEAEISYYEELVLYLENGILLKLKSLPF